MAKVCHLEEIPPHSWLMRIGPEGWKFGEPYEIITIIVFLGEGVCEIRGLDKPLTVSHWRAMTEYLNGIGIHRAVFDRKKPTGSVRKSVSPGESKEEIDARS